MPSIINAPLSGGVTITSDTSGVLQLQTASTTAMTIDASQNVGIGTTSPTADLDILRGNEEVRIQLNNTNSGTGTTNGLALILGADGVSNFIAAYESTATVNVYVNGATRTITNTYGIGLGDSSPPTSGMGIRFPATQSASSDANTLDDYEEGTWTPSAGSESGAYTATYSDRAGLYVKIGNRVWCTFDCTLTSRTLTGSIANLYGLPFPVNNNGNLSGSFGAPAICSSIGSNFYQVGIYAQPGSSLCYIQTTTSNTSGLTVAPNSFWGSSTRLAGGFFYNTTS